MQYSVDLDELESVVGDMAAFDQRLVEHLANLDAMIAALHESWTGEAADLQRRAHERWKQGAEEMHQALVRMREAGAQAHQNYTSAVEANQQMWQQVQ